MNTYKCPVCGALFTNPGYLGDHVDWKYGDTLREVADLCVCWCGEMFEYMQDLGRHVAYHPNPDLHLVLYKLSRLG